MLRFHFDHDTAHFGSEHCQVVYYAVDMYPFELSQFQ